VTTIGNLRGNVQEVPTGGSPMPSYRLRLLQRFFQRRSSALGLILVILILLAAVAAPLIAPYAVNASVGDLNAPPSYAHALGTDRLGRDVLTRVLYGARISLLIGIGAQSISMAIGIAVGTLTGYFGGKVDLFLMRVVDVFMAFPFILLAMMIVASIGAGVENVIFAVGLTGWTGASRIIRGEVLRVREEEFVLAARALGASHGRILLLHVLPNILHVTITLYTIGIGTAILAESALSFIGLGVQPPDPSWGLELSFGQQRIFTSPHLALVPSLAILITVLGFNLLGDGLRDVLDPRDAGLASHG
jgi:peptide/nickel transport system permease protein